METKERMTGLRFAVQPTRENIAQCSELSAKLLRELVERHKITYNQILYPYADALLLSGAAGTQSTRIFGTHILLRNVPDEIIENVNPKGTITLSSPEGEDRSLKAQLRAAEKAILQKTLAETGSTLEGKRTAAGILGISESTLYRRLREFDLL